MFTRIIKDQLFARSFSRLCSIRTLSYKGDFMIMWSWKLPRKQIFYCLGFTVVGLVLDMLQRKAETLCFSELYWYTDTGARQCLQVAWSTASQNHIVTSKQIRNGTYNVENRGVSTPRPKPPSTLLTTCTRHPRRLPELRTSFSTGWYERQSITEHVSHSTNRRETERGGSLVAGDNSLLVIMDRQTPWST